MARRKLRRKAKKGWRQSSNYRKRYLASNPGLLGSIWFCSQCGKPLLRSKNVRVDHIIPPSRFVKDGEVTSWLAVALNSNFNTVACCQKCNARKSDKVGLVTLKGMGAKAAEVSLFSAQKIASLGIAGAAMGLWGAGKLLIAPTKVKFKRKTNKIVFLLIYVLILACLFHWIKTTLSS